MSMDTADGRFVVLCHQQWEYDGEEPRLVGHSFHECLLERDHEGVCVCHECGIVWLRRRVPVNRVLESALRRLNAVYRMSSTATLNIYWPGGIDIFRDWFPDTIDGHPVSHHFGIEGVDVRCYLEAVDLDGSSHRVGFNQYLFLKECIDLVSAT